MKKVALRSITFCLFLIACKKENTQTIIPDIPLPGIRVIGVIPDSAQIEFFYTEDFGLDQIPFYFIANTNMDTNDEISLNCYLETCISMEGHITESGNNLSYVKGDFWGSLRDEDGIAHSCSGEFSSVIN